MTGTYWACKINGRYYLAHSDVLLGNFQYLSPKGGLDTPYCIGALFIQRCFQLGNSNMKFGIKFTFPFDAVFIQNHESPSKTFHSTYSERLTTEEIEEFFRGAKEEDIRLTKHTDC